MVAVPVTATGLVIDAPSGLLQVGDGSSARTILSVRRLDLPDQPFSPAGGFVAGYRDGRTTVIDLASGAEVASVPGEVAGWYDDDRLVLRVGSVVRVVDFRTGRQLAERQLAPAGWLVTGTWLAPVRGTPPPGAVVL